LGHVSAVKQPRGDGDGGGESIVSVFFNVSIHISEASDIFDLAIKPVVVKYLSLSIRTLVRICGKKIVSLVHGVHARYIPP
jgi:hypothetical protein